MTERCREYLVKPPFGKNGAPAEFLIPSDYLPAPLPSQIDVVQVVDLLREHIEKCIPLSLIRLGDGEAAVIAYPEFVSRRHINMLMKLFFGFNKLTRAERLTLSYELRSAVTSADVVGIFGGEEITTYSFARVMIEHRKLLGKQSTLCSAQVHIDLQNGNWLHEILKNLKVIGIVTCRDVAELLRSAFTIERVVTYTIPEEGRHAKVRYDVARHYPDRFESMRQELNVEFPGMVFLVGAGVCGKVYCKWIKERGGIAIDVGSLFDGWAGIPSRHYLRERSDCGEEVVLQRYQL